MISAENKTHMQMSQGPGGSDPSSVLRRPSVPEQKMMGGGGRYGMGTGMELEGMAKQVKGCRSYYYNSHVNGGRDGNGMRHLQRCSSMKFKIVLDDTNTSDHHPSSTRHSHHDE